MRLDTRATVFVLHKILYDLQFNQWPLRSNKIKLRAYTTVSEFPSMVKFICLSYYSTNLVQFPVHYAKKWKAN